MPELEEEISCQLGSGEGKDAHAQCKCQNALRSQK